MMQRAASNSKKKVANSLVAMSSAAVLAVYTAGYVRTRPTADRLAEQAFERSFARVTTPAETAAEPKAPPPVAPARPTARPSPATIPDSGRTPKTAAHPSSSVASVPASATPAAPNVAAVQTPAESPGAAAAPVSAPATSESPAPAAAEPQVQTPASAPIAPASPVWKDGKYTAWGTCRHGDIQATVVIEAGQIVSAEITNCQTRYACDVIDSLPGKVVKRQKNKFDAIGGATESAYAYYGAVYWALDQASK